MGGLEYEIGGKSWRIVCLEAFSGIDEGGKREIFEAMTRMYDNKEHKGRRIITHGDFSAVVEGTGRYLSLAGLGGYEYVADVQTRRARFCAHFLAAERIDPNNN